MSKGFWEYDNDVVENNDQSEREVIYTKFSENLWQYSDL